GSLRGVARHPLGGGGGVGLVRHGRRLAPAAWSTLWRAAEGRAGGGGGAPAGCGVAGGGGSDGRRRQRKGGGRAPYPGAASRGVGVQTGGDGRGRVVVGRSTRVRRLAGWGFRRAATAGAGPGRCSPLGPALPTGGRCPVCRVQWWPGSGPGGLRTSASTPMTSTST